MKIKFVFKSALKFHGQCRALQLVYLLKDISVQSKMFLRIADRQLWLFLKRSFRFVNVEKQIWKRNDRFERDETKLWQFKKKKRNDRFQNEHSGKRWLSYDHSGKRYFLKTIVFKKRKTVLKRKWSFWNESNRFEKKTLF